MKLFPLQQMTTGQQSGGVTNSLTLTAVSAQTNYPFQFGRPFVQGAVPHLPQVLVDGVPAATQADVKNRYPDGSVKFAVLAVVLPSLPAGQPVTLTFQDTQAPPAAPLTQAQMVAALAGQDATLAFTFPDRLMGGNGPQLAINTTLAVLRGFANGGFTVNVNGSPVTVSGMNFSAAEDWQTVQNILRAAGAAKGLGITLGGNPWTQTYLINITAPAAIGFAAAPTDGSQDMSATFGLTQAQGAAILAKSTASISASAMLSAGHYEAWTSGPIAQTVRLRDDSQARTYDIGNGDGFHPIRPGFDLTFWNTGRVFANPVIENGISSELEDVAYSVVGAVGGTQQVSLDLTGGVASQSTHQALCGARLRMNIGAAPSNQVSIDHNLAYLRSTRFLPSYDPAVGFNATALANAYASFSGHPHGPFDGQWNGGFMWVNAMAEGGARADIGPNVGWYTWALQSKGDWRMLELLWAAADTAASFPLQLREADPTKRLLRDDPQPQGGAPATGYGRTISVTDRPSICARNLTLGDTKTADRVTFVGTFGSGAWSADGAHQPNAYYIPYLLSGDPYYLHQMYLWVGFSAARYNGADTTASDGRGPTGSEGAIADELRGAGWIMRSRAEIAFIAPDGDPEKTYFGRLLNDAIARWEGGFGIAGTVFDGSAIKTWGQQQGNAYSDFGPLDPGNSWSRTPPALHNWEANGNPAFDDSEVDAQVSAGVMTTSAGNWTTPWMQAYVQYCLGRVVELGFIQAKPLMLWSGKFSTDEIMASGMPEIMVDLYEMPVFANTQNGQNPTGATPPGGPFTWAQMRTIALTANWVNTTGPAQFTNNALPNPQAYPHLRLGGMAALVDQGAPDAAAAWAWLEANVIPHCDYSQDPSWKLIPRDDNNVLPAQPTATS